MPDEMDLTASQTRLSESIGSSAFDYGRFAPGVVLADRYRIIGLLGRGGMGEVYRADDLTLGQSVALKFLPERIDADRASLDRLLSEVRTARQVSHPNVCRVHDVGEIGPSTGSGRSRRFISMEYIDGEDLSVLLRRIGRLPSDKGVEIARQLCAGLAASHERGVLHRDLKPANIMLDGRGRVRITDFGLATLQAHGAGAGEFAGTPAYMAPEQREGKAVSVQTDIYALGLVMYEVFTGKRYQHDLSDELLDPAIARVIERCLDPDPHRRPASCALVAASLPGGDPLAAAIAAGETPSPQLVAAATVQGALSPAMALLLGLLFLVSLGIVAAGLWSPPKVFGFSRSAEVLSAQTRDLLADLGYPDTPADTTSGFRYRYPDWRNPAVVDTERPWSQLAGLRPAAVFFWYREHPTALSGSEMGRLGLEGLSMPLRSVMGPGATDPTFEDGSVYVERAPDGSLDTLFVRPGPGAAGTTAPVDWSRLFAEARLDMNTFTTTAPDPALALPGDSRVAWTGKVVGEPEVLRVEAASLDGRPTAFRVLGPRTTVEFGAVPFVLADRSAAARITTYSTLAFLLIAYAGAAFFMGRNARLGRGDRRGAARLARVIGLLAFAASMLSAAPPLDVRIVGTMHGAAAIGLFAGAWCWAFYMAIEPFVRRQWPRMLIGWSRLMAGEWRDPQVGREVFLGAFTTVVTTVLMVAAHWGILRAGGEPPVNEMFHFRALGGIIDVTAGLLQVVPWTMFASMMWVVLLLLVRRLLRSDYLALAVLGVMTLFMSPATQWMYLLAMFIGNAAVLLMAMRVGFLALISSVVVSQVIISLPFSPGASGVIGSLSWISLLAVAVPSFFGLYTALAGQSVFGSGDPD